MIRLNTVLDVVDNTNVHKVRAFGVSGYSKIKRAWKIGDILLCSIQDSSNKDLPRKKVLKALVVRTKKSYSRVNGDRIKFFHNGVFLLSREELALLGNRANGPIAKEAKTLNPKIANWEKMKVKLI